MLTQDYIDAFMFYVNITHNTFLVPIQPVSYTEK